MVLYICKEGYQVHFIMNVKIREVYADLSLLVTVSARLDDMRSFSLC